MAGEHAGPPPHVGGYGRYEIGRLILFLSGLLALPTPALAQTVTQTLTLQPGWNAVWLEVQPTNNSSDAVFAGLPVSSVWTRAERINSADFIQNPSEESFNRDGWLAWFPPSRPEALVGNLFTVTANRAYLIQSTNSTPIVWTLTGRPSLRSLGWAPDAYNLRGLPVDPAAPPTFLNFFRHSTAHYNTTAGQLERIYRLDPVTSQWAQVAPGALMRSGEAYWVYTRGGSDYMAPIKTRVTLGDGLDFGLELSQLDLRLANATAFPQNITVQEVGQPGATLLSYSRLDPVQGFQWPILPSTLGVTNASGAESTVQLAVRRQDMTGLLYESILEIRDGAGTRLLVPLRAEKKSGLARAGLWVGSAVINAVSQRHSVALSAGDLTDATSLAAQLKQPTTPLAQHLVANELSSATRLGLTNYPGSGPVPGPLQTNLLADLNRLLRSSSLYDAQRFAGIVLREETQRLLSMNPLGQGSAFLRNFNRLLLEDAFPGIARDHSASASSTMPTPTKSTLNLRLLLHVDANGQTRLLKEVIQMWRDGTTTNDASGNGVVDKPGQYVLITDDRLLSQFKGATLRDGRSVGRRLSSIGFEFSTTPGANFAPLSGNFAFGQSLTGALTLPSSHPTNPFFHRYHPDHDNLNARYDGPAAPEEVFSVTRQIELEFTATPPAGPASAEYGYNDMGGNYRENLLGLHKQPVSVSGTFRLTRVSQIDALNPNPIP